MKKNTNMTLGWLTLVTIIGLALTCSSERVSGHDGIRQARAYAAHAERMGTGLELEHEAHARCAKSADNGQLSGRLVTKQEMQHYRACITDHNLRWGGLARGRDVGFGRVTTRAFSHSIWSDESNRSSGLDRLRFRAEGQFSNSPWGFVFEVDLSRTEELKEDGDWAHEFTVWRQLSQCSRALSGKVFTAAQGTVPPPLDLTPVYYPRSVPYNAYAYGIQYEHKCVGGDGKQDGWFWVADVTGSSGLVFDDDGALDFSEQEFSFRLRSPPDRFQHVVSGQLGHHFTRLGAWTKWWAVPERFLLWGGMYYTDEHLVDRRKPAPVLLVEWRPAGAVRPFLELEKPGDSWEGQIGINLFAGEWGRMALAYHTERVLHGGERAQAVSLLLQLHDHR